MRIKILLLQARAPDDPMREHELACFVSRTGLPRESLAPHDLCQGPPTLARLRRCDALMVGGSGDFYVSKGNLPRFDALMDFMREVVQQGYPTFASCFGFQCLVRALGGGLVHDPDRAEVGTYDLTLTAEGRADSLFGSLPGRFAAQLGHKDRAERLTDDVVNLAASDCCEFQALRVPRRPIWATQFHPELDRGSNLDRLHRYVDQYGPQPGEDLAAVEARFGESPETSSLLPRFLELVFGTAGVV